MIQSFATVEEMFAAIDDGVKLERESYENGPEWRRALKHDDCFVSFKTEYGVWVVGKVVERSDYPEDDESIKETRKNGFVFARCYSTECVEGEFGDVAASVIHLKIDKEEFEVLKSKGWEIDRQKHDSWVELILHGL